MKRLFSVFISSVTAGILISIGGLVFLSAKESSLIGASLLFAFGLFVVIFLKLYLYTGKIGYVFENKPSFLLNLLICLIGNAIGSVGTGYLFYFGHTCDSRLNVIYQNALALSETKLSSSPVNLLILSFFCGILIFLAVEIARRDFHPLIKAIGIFLPVAIFILTGFEHCVADMFYFSAANAWNGKAIGSILLIILGNSAGSIAFYGLIRCSSKANGQ